MAEHREHIRINASLMISHRLLKESYRTGSRSKDISEGGICFPSHRRIEPETNLELEIHISEFKKPIIATGVVVWICNRDDAKYPYLVGVKFIKIKLLDRRKLQYYISTKSKEGISKDIKWVG